MMDHMYFDQVIDAINSEVNKRIVRYRDGKQILMQVNANQVLSMGGEHWMIQKGKTYTFEDDAHKIISTFIDDSITYARSVGEADFDSVNIT